MGSEGPSTLSGNGCTSAVERVLFYGLSFPLSLTLHPMEIAVTLAVAPAPLLPILALWPRTTPRVSLRGFIRRKNHCGQINELTSEIVVHAWESSEHLK